MKKPQETPFTIFLAAMIAITVVVLGSGAYFWKTRSSSEKKITIEEITKSQDNQSITTKEVIVFEDKQVIPSSPKDVRNKLLLLPSKNPEYGNAYILPGAEDFDDSSFCDIETNRDPPNEKISYIDKERGISFSVPFNENWGTDQYRISPYDEIEDRVLFGLIGHPNPEGATCGFFDRFYFMEFIPVRTQDAIVVDFKTIIKEWGREPAAEIKTGSINGYAYVGMAQILEYDMGWLPTKVEIIGRKYNYVFVTEAGGGSVEYLVTLIEPLKLID